MEKNDALKNLTQNPLWNNFYHISQIPRESGNEAAIAKYLIKRAAATNAEVFQDSKGNVVIKKNVTHKRSSNKPIIAIQGHMDMVCEKIPQSNHDFKKDPLSLRIEKRNNETYMRANGTTLGADNGYALVCGLTLLEEPDLKDIPLELIFTVDEECGLTGALNFDSHLCDANWIINLDSEEEGEFVIGCAGGKTICCTKQYTPLFLSKEEQQHFIPMEIKVDGFKGGHSGVEIDKNRNNAIIFLASLLKAIPASSCYIEGIEATGRHNVIPSSACAKVLIKTTEADNVRLIIKDLEQKVLSSEPEATITMKKYSFISKGVLSQQDYNQIISFLANMPYGVVSYAKEYSDVVETSLNPSSFTLDKNFLAKFECSFRSLKENSLAEICNSIKERAIAIGYLVKEFGEYPGWNPNSNSPLLQCLEEQWEQLFKIKAVKKVIHAGLECGVLAKKMKMCEFISIGPNIFDVHSPNEAISIESGERVYRFLVHLLSHFYN